MSDSTQAARLLRAGIAAAQAGRAEEARQTLLQVTELDERNERAWLWLSGVIESSDDRRICLENVLAINPDNPHAQRGLQLLDQQAAPAPAAQEHCPRCQAAVPESGSVCPDCGQVLIVACPACGEYVAVEEISCPACGQLLGDFRDGAGYHLTLAQAYAEQQQYKRAEEAIFRAEAEAPGDLQILLSAAALYEEMGHTDLAIAVYESVIERFPGNVVPYTRLGAIYRRRAMPAEARTMYELAAERAGDNPAILFDLAQLYVEEDGATQDILTLLERVVHLDPEHSHAHLLLGNVYLKRGQVQQAIEQYERASELTTPDSLLGREARHEMAKLHPSLPQQAQGWGTTLRLMTGLMIPPVLAALVNARMTPWKISLAAWGALAAAIVGAYLWACATDVPRNPAMCALFGEKGVKGLWKQAIVGLPGVLLWGAALGLILGKV